MPNFLWIYFNDILINPNNAKYICYAHLFSGAP